MLSQKEFIQQFIDATEINIDSELSFESRFRDLDDWSSLAGLCVMQMMTELTGKSFTVSDIKSCDTIGDLYKYLDNNETN